MNKTRQEALAATIQELEQLKLQDVREVTITITSVRHHGATVQDSYTEYISRITTTKIL